MIGDAASTESGVEPSASSAVNLPMQEALIRRLSLSDRHESPLVTPSRGGTSARGSNSNHTSPYRLSRPRSNPRNRTPMRYESPLDPDAFRIREVDEERTRDVNTAARTETGRITIRPMAGSAIGTAITAPRIREDRIIHQQAKSRKQGPSQRKVRRWNNDNFINLASELSKSNGRSAAQALLHGHADAKEFRSVFDPSDHRCDALSRFMEDEKLKDVRDRFFQGELTQNPVPSRSRKAKDSPLLECTPELMLNRIDARLRRVVVKACTNSYPASQVVDTFETYLVRAFAGKQYTTSNVTWDGILIDPPTITRVKKDDAVIVKFYFDAESSTAGFHRLLLHGLCQFHGLQAISTTINVLIKDHTRSRVLTVSGKLSGAKVKLVEQVMKRQKVSNEVEAASTSFSTLKV